MVDMMAMAGLRGFSVLNSPAWPQSGLEHDI